MSVFVKAPPQSESSAGLGDCASEPLYRCNGCGETFALDGMAITRKNGIVRSMGRCKPCDNLRKRRSERRREAFTRADGVQVEPVADNDPTPARLLVELLRGDRDQWRLSFEDAWADDVDFVLALIVHPRAAERERLRGEWSVAFESQRAAWAAAWAQEPGPGAKLSAALADDLTGSRTDGELLA